MDMQVNNLAKHENIIIKPCMLSLFMMFAHNRKFKITYLFTLIA